jgi:hypothetical protein
MWYTINSDTRNYKRCFLVYQANDGQVYNVTARGNSYVIGGVVPAFHDHYLPILEGYEKKIYPYRAGNFLLFGLR